ncbi:class I SAM-dependent methyltransferase [Lentibacillus cibarius]|uniref:Class I SAM-dependent methyltransferase n=1 Tax=Lentibacillus cibarius TaxID=2583219 RepID=A0A549YM72_9BACI|nr:class I SAM-dependent methyltransferase [Lentibacillus cibarius]TMN21177.1 class I SAM-dependent methyltransferase [Lentibacillus cibarius]TRM12957.1 class I SAM-dependent methyltransferase [Lentibacillus cibarius]
MEKTDVELLFEQIDNITETVQHYENETYLDSLVLTLEIMFYQNPLDGIDEQLKEKLQSLINDFNVKEYETTQIRKALQLAILKGMKGATQQQHLMTPETVALFVGYLAGKLTGGKEKIRMFDPASGTGNLLMAVWEQLENVGAVYASEVDTTLIKLAVMNANLQKREVEFFHQDSLRPFLLDPVDLVISDLPVGYYPDDISANDYELKADEGYSYSHHLFIEQSINYTVPGGYLIFVIPEFLFDSDQSDKLHAYLQEKAHIVGVLQLPETAFKSEKNRKSILILQKKGSNTSAVRQPLLVQVPSFKNTKAMNDILAQMNSWFSTNINL